MQTWTRLSLAALLALPIYTQAADVPIMVTTLFNDELEAEIITKMQQLTNLSLVANDNYGTPIRLLSP